MSDLERQVLETVKDYRYGEIAARELPIGVDIRYSYMQILSAAIGLAAQGLLFERQMYFGLTNAGEKVLSDA